MLKLLKHLNLESNELSEHPVGFGKLNCDTLCLNCNNFAVFPDCVTYMPLTHLSIDVLQHPQVGCCVIHGVCIHVSHPPEDDSLPPTNNIHADLRR